MKCPPYGLKVEICSAWDLPSMDAFGENDPYVMVWLEVGSNHTQGSKGSDDDRKLLHTTKAVFASAQPMWTALTNSTFLISSEDTRTMIQAGKNRNNNNNDNVETKGLRLEVHDKDNLSFKDDLVGSTELLMYDKDLLVRGGGVEVPLFKKGRPAGYVSLNVSVACAHDAALYECTLMEKTPFLNMGDIDDTENEYNVGYLDVTKPPSKKMLKKFLSNYNKKNKPSLAEVVVEQLEAMTKTPEEVMEECLLPSKHWVECGSLANSAGYLDVEILYGNHLRKHVMSLESRPDPFVALSYEETLVTTSVVSNAKHNSPRWLPFMRRAFRFYITHPSSNLYLGILDYNLLSSHHTMGRLNINVSALPHQRQLLLQYDIPDDFGNSNKNKERSTLTVRMYKQVQPRLLLWKSLTLLVSPRIRHAQQQRQQIYTRDKKLFKVLNYTLHGTTTDDTDVRLNTLKRYVEELKGYTKVGLYVRQGLAQVLFWRGTFQLNVGSQSFWVPLHSILAFAAGIHLSNHLELLPSYFVGTLAFIMWGTMTFRQNHPDPWQRSLSYRHHCFQLLWGWLPQPIITSDNINVQFMEEHEEFWQNVMDTDNEKSLLQQSLQQEKQKADTYVKNNTSHHNNNNALSFQLNSIWNFLHPIQDLLLQILIKLRIITNILTWEESYVAFWLTNALILVTVAFAYVPWDWLIQWTIKLSVWTFLGPWMFIVGLFVLHNDDLEKESALVQALIHQFQAKARRVAHQQRRKMDMKVHLFGTYASTVPIFKQEHPLDTPASPSTSSLPEQSLYNGANTIRVIGQEIDLDGYFPRLQHAHDLETWSQSHQPSPSDHDTNGYGAIDNMV